MWFYLLYVIMQLQYSFPLLFLSINICITLKFLPFNMPRSVLVLAKNKILCPSEVKFENFHFNQRFSFYTGTKQVVISTTINLHVLWSFWSQKQISTIFRSEVSILMYRDSLLRFMRKWRAIELKVVIIDNRNLHIAVILSPKSSPYDVQKRS